MNQKIYSDLYIGAWDLKLNEPVMNWRISGVILGGGK